MKRLAALADVLIAEGTPGGPSSSHAANVGFAPAEGERGQELQPVVFSTETLARARDLGLASRHVEPRLELASLRRYAWTPLSDEPVHSGAPQLPLPSGSPEHRLLGVEVRSMLRPWRLPDAGALRLG
jgi:hypothetical protein